MEPPPGWLWSIATARAFGAFNGMSARELAHHALCAGIYHDVLVEIDGREDLTPEEAYAIVGDLLEAFGTPRLTKETVYWIVVSDYVRNSDPAKTSYEVAWLIPSLVVDYDPDNQFWALKGHGEAVWEFRHPRGFAGFPTWWGLSRGEFIELERSVDERIQTLREWRSGLGDEAEAWIRMWANRSTDWVVWLDPGVEWTLDSA
jgi:hypothetical protein